MRQPRRHSAALQAILDDRPGLRLSGDPLRRDRVARREGLLDRLVEQRFLPLFQVFARNPFAWRRLRGLVGVGLSAAGAFDFMARGTPKSRVAGLAEESVMELSIDVSNLTGWSWRGWPGTGLCCGSRHYRLHR